MYGVEYLRAYNAEDQDHVARKDRLTELPSGPKLLADAFDCILARVSCHYLPYMSFSHSQRLIGRESQRVNRVHAKVLHRTHQSVHALSL